MGGFAGLLPGLRDAGDVPAHIAPALARFQFDNMRRRIPALHIVALLNLAIVDLVLWHDGTPLAYYGWTPLIALFSAFRLVQWLRWNRATPTSDAAIRRALDSANIAVTLAVAVVSTFTVATYLLGDLRYPLLIPLSLTFGAFSIGHAMAPMRFASIAAHMFGVAPIGLAMLVAGDFMAKVLALSMLSVVMLKVSFLRDYQTRMVETLALQWQIHEYATRDALTGVLNRRAIEEELASAVAAGHPFALALIDLDDFKGVNDRLGHHAGDALLKTVAWRIAGHARHAGRLGGDEFIALIDAAGASEASERMSALLVGIVVPAMIEGERLPVGASLGYARFPEDGRDGETLMRSADDALYAAKRAGKRRALGFGQMVEPENPVCLTTCLQGTV